MGNVMMIHFLENFEGINKKVILHRGQKPADFQGSPTALQKFGTT